MAHANLPGTITQRQLVQDSESGDEDDFGTFALLKTGNEKKAALKERERLKNLQSMEIGGKAEAMEAPDCSAAKTASPKASPKPPLAGAKRPRRGKMAANKAPTPEKAHDLDDDELEEVDRKLAQSNKEHDDRLRKMKDTLKELDNDDDDDDDDDEALPAARARAGPSLSSRFTPQHLWLTIVAEREGQLTRTTVRCLTDQPLEAKLLHRIASELGYLPERMALWAGGQQLDVQRSALELGLADKQEVRVEEIEPPKGLKLRLSREGEREPTAIHHPPNRNFSELLSAYCTQQGLSPSIYRLQFDGDTLSPSATPADADMEDDDLVEVVRAM